MVEWDSPDWGKPGHNVHLSHDGSWADRRDERRLDWSALGVPTLGRERPLEEMV